VLLRLAFLPLGLSVLAGPLASPAHACQARTGCWVGHVAPGAGATVPGNVPGLLVSHETLIGEPALTLLDPEAELLDASGNQVPVARNLGASPGQSVLVPKQPLAPGSYRLRRKVRCDYQATAGGIPHAPMAEEVTFTTTAATPLPTRAGAITVGGPSRENYDASGYDPFCSWNELAVVVRLALEPSAELAPFLPVARISTKVDGMSWAASEYGGGTRVPRSIYYAPRVPLAFYARCVTGPSGTLDPGLSEGAHQGELSVHLAGMADPLPPIPFNFTLSCANAASPDAGGSTDAEVSETGATGDASPPLGNDAGSSAHPDGGSPVSDGPSPDKSTSGCSTLGAPSATREPLVPLLLAVVILIRLCRRRSPEPEQARASKMIGAARSDS
jgi:hypothetical protein